MAGPPGFAYKGFFQAGRETAGNYGVAVASTHRFPLLALPQVAPAREHIDSDVMDGTGLLLQRYSGKKVSRFTVELECTYTNWPFLWDLILGTATYGSNGGSSGAGPPYTHTFVHKDLLNSVTAQMGMGDIPAGQCERATGAKLATARISGAFHERVRASLSFVGKDFQTDQTPTVLASPTIQDCVLMDQLSAFNDGIGSTGTILGFELSIDNMIPDRDFASELIEEPLRQDFPTMSLMIREEFQSNAALEAQMAKTTGAPSLTFTSGTKSLVLSLGGADLDPVTREAEGRGRIIQPLTWKPFKVASTYLTVALTNAQSTITTYT